MILVLCPTRGRPAAAGEAYRSFLDTRASDETEMLFVVDNDDPLLDAYQMAEFPVRVQERPGNMNAALNRAAIWASDAASPFTVLGFVGDDHRFRTKGWDATIDGYLTSVGGGFAYGNDLAQGMNLPTQVFVSSWIVRELGWLGLPGCYHLYLDNTWKVLGEESGALYYFPDVVIEHLHPSFGKGEWDAGHIRVNEPHIYSHDGGVFNEWLSSRAHGDIAKVRAGLHR